MVEKLAKLGLENHGIEESDGRGRRDVEERDSDKRDEDSEHKIATERSNISPSR